MNNSININERNAFLKTPESSSDSMSNPSFFGSNEMSNSFERKKKVKVLCQNCLNWIP